MMEQILKLAEQLTICGIESATLKMNKDWWDALGKDLQRTDLFYTDWPFEEIGSEVDMELKVPVLTLKVGAVSLTILEALKLK